MNIKETGELILRGIDRVVFGPETKGYVKAVKRDPNDPLCYHVLVETDDGRFRHFTRSEERSASNLRIDFATGEIGFGTMNKRVGQRWKCRTRGTGVWLSPGSNIERNPFNL